MSAEKKKKKKKRRSQAETHWREEKKKSAVTTVMIRRRSQGWRTSTSCPDPPFESNCVSVSHVCFHCPFKMKPLFKHSEWTTWKHLNCQQQCWWRFSAVQVIIILSANTSASGLVSISWRQRYNCVNTDEFSWTTNQTLCYLHFLFLNSWRCYAKVLFFIYIFSDFVYSCRLFLCTLILCKMSFLF